jgi:hypothetical protein
MRRRWLILLWAALLGIVPAVRSQSAPTAPVAVPAESALAQDESNLDLKRSLDVRHADLLQRFQAWNQQAQAYNSQYANRDLDPKSAEYAAGQAMLSRLSSDLSSYNDDNAAFAADVARLVPRPPPPVTVPSRVDLYVDMRTLLAQEKPKYDPAKIQAEIDGVKTALQRLDAVRENNASRIEEWQKTSEKASHDAWEMGANMSVDLLSSALKNRAEAIDKQLQNEADLLAGETDPARRKAIQDTFKELSNHKEQLEKANEAAEAAHKEVDRLSKLDEADDTDEESKDLRSTSEKVGEALNQAWEYYDLAGGPLPEGAKEAKQMVDAVYLASVQFVSVGQINSANDDAGQYLKAVTVLSQKMKELVDLKQKAAAENAAPENP